MIHQDGVLTIGKTALSIRIEREPLDVDFSPREKFGEAIARSRAMRHVFGLLEQAAQSDVTVLLEGESGTGKDVLAVGLHTESARKDNPFVVFDCAATPDGLFESELFGHERGAFTGAFNTHPGALEQAHGGTLFLDEIGELPLESQRKLLRALENRSFRRVGGKTTIHADVRVVAATNRRLREAVRKGEFREDLFYRLAVVQVPVPRLAERPDDIVPLAELFLRRAAGKEGSSLSPELIRLLLSYDWPGNARELRNVVERFAAFERVDHKLLFSSAISSQSYADDVIPLAALDRLPYHEAKRCLMERFHKLLLPRTLERAGGSIPQAAQLLGIPRTSLYRMLQQMKTDSGTEE